jgi:multiple sugar transport system ATP-binding protein
MEHLLDRRPGQLSGGQRQRVAIGRAIVREPEVFLFDEPLSNLDASLRVDMRMELSKLHKELGATMVYVTHDQVEAMTLADKIVVLNGGVVQQVGSPIELYQRPANRFVAGFIGSPKMNFAAVTVRAVGFGNLTVAGMDVAAIAVPADTSGIEIGHELTLGIRPHDLTLDAAGTIAGRITLVERLGSETIVGVELPSNASWLVVLDGDSPLHVGDDIAVSVAPERASLFDVDDRSLRRD